MRLTRALLIIVGLAAILGAAPAGASHPNALWRVVHDLCVTDMKMTGLPAPCLVVDRHRGFAILKDLKGRTQILLIPTKRVSGIESSKLMRSRMRPTIGNRRGSRAAISNA